MIEKMYGDLVSNFNDSGLPNICAAQQGEMEVMRREMKDKQAKLGWPSDNATSRDQARCEVDLHSSGVSFSELLEFKR